MQKPLRQRKKIIDDGFTYLLLKKFTPNIGILFGSPKSIVPLEGEDNAPTTLVYESTFHSRKWREIKRNLKDFWTSTELPAEGTIQDWLSLIAKQLNKFELPEIQSILNNPAISDNNPAKLDDLFNLAITLFDDGHHLFAIQTIGTLHPETKGNYNGGTSRLLSRELDQETSIVDFTVYTLALRDALADNQIEEAQDIIYQKIISLVDGIKDKNIRLFIYHELGLALLEKACEE